MLEIEAKYKVTNLVKDMQVYKAYEITCPFCNSTIMFEEDLVSFCTALFCGFCKHKIAKEALSD